LETIHYLEKSLSTLRPDAQQKATAKFMHALEQLASASVDAMPVLGLMEMRLWVKAKHDHETLKSVFLAAVAENLKAMK
jgi:hypothetical protein